MFHNTEVITSLKTCCSVKIIIFYRFFRVKTIQERLGVVEKRSCFEITAFFPSSTQCVKKGGNFKIGKFFNYPELFLHCLYRLYSKNVVFPFKMFLLIPLESKSFYHFNTSLKFRKNSICEPNFVEISVKQNSERDFKTDYASKNQPNLTQNVSKEALCKKRITLKRTAAITKFVNSIVM